ncbi:MAG: glycosyl transferase [Alphaproteobacteria bacterium]|jgi:hypothetical protein|nr:glycosyl transferase [Alphaproteobacteria bacterium]
MSAAAPTLGVVMLCHTALDRAAQVARFWLDAGCAVALHIDSAVPQPQVAAMQAELGDQPLLRMVPRLRCDWGSWNIVAASQNAAEILLRDFAQIGHVLLSSGSCLPLRPAAELVTHLRANEGTDFIESVAVDHADWITGGLSRERFTLYFPFSWRKQRWLFDRWVDLQRRWGISREIPRPLEPHMGSQWWCLSRATLNAILTHPKRKRYERYFKGCWIPDESYFQTLARLHGQRIESRSLTLVKFDRNGRPNLFYDDHLQLLRRSDCFLARKIWPQADKLYGFFLSDQPARLAPVTPEPAKIDRYFELAEHQRTEGRAGLYMQSRFPHDDSGQALTAGPYSVFSGFDKVFQGFDYWLGQVTGTRAHGDLFAPERANFHGGAHVWHGAISNSAALRDYNPRMFLTNLIWATRGERQCFSITARDHVPPDLLWFMAKDRNAQISLISGCFLLPLFRGDYRPDDLLGHVAWLQKREQHLLSVLQSRWVNADVRIWTLAEFMEAPERNLSEVVSKIVPDVPLASYGLPQMRSLDGFQTYLRDLRNKGLPPVLLRDFEGRTGVK